jgi:hypothetical protein
MSDVTKAMQRAAGRIQMGTPQQFLRLVGATEDSIKATDLQHGRYQNPNELASLISAYKTNKPLPPAEIIVDEAKNIIGADGRHRALAAAKANVREFPIIIRRRVAQVTRLAEDVMKTGEGSAICKAGTSNVSAVFKATSRIIKNSL